MRYGMLSSLTTVSILVALNLPCFAQTTVTISANAGCVDTGVNVSKGDSIQFSAVGQGSYGYEGSPVNSTPITNADGDRFVNNFSIGKKIDPNAINSSAPIGSLVGKIGGNSNYFYVGSGNQLTMQKSGTIILCYNDLEGGYSDNQGGFKVTIYRK